MSDKIERIIDALRKKILESAIRGELVPQNPEDEPASKLLERIAEERERLIKEKKIKKPKSSSHIFRRDGHFYESINGGKPTCIDDDIPFEIPESWEWCRLESICEVNPRNKLNDELAAGFIPMASVREGFSNYHDVNIKKWGDIKSGYTHLRNNDVIVAKITPCFQNRKSAIVVNLPNGYGAGSTEFHVARTLDEEIIPSFLLVLFKSEYFIQKGFATFTGTAGQQRISSDFFSSFLVALPPTNEQFRLVHEVQDRLQALNDIEKSQKRYKRILSETPTSLRQQLLQSAIQGQLVPQNPNDEPASVLLERIAEERASKMGKKAVKSMSRIVRRGSKTYEFFPDGSEKDISGDIPFEIPSSWEWCRVGAIFTLQAGKFISSASISEMSDKSPYPCYGGNGCRGYVGIFNRDGDYPLIGRQGALCGNINRATGKFYATEHAVCVESYYCVNVDWLCLFLRALNLNRYATATAQPGLAVSTLNEVLFPLPPQEEQNRIAKTVRLLSASVPL